MLYDGGGGQGAQQDYFYQASGTVPKSKLNWEEFKKDLAKRVRVQKVAVAPTVPKNKEKEAEAEDEEETCLVCTDKLKDRCVLKSAPPSALPFPALFLLTGLRGLVQGCVVARISLVRVSSVLLCACRAASWFVVSQGPAAVPVLWW